MSDKREREAWDWAEQAVSDYECSECERVPGRDELRKIIHDALTGFARAEPQPDEGKVEGRFAYDDEIVFGPLHMERMDNDHIWFAIRVDDDYNHDRHFHLHAQVTGVRKAVLHWVGFTEAEEEQARAAIRALRGRGV